MRSTLSRISPPVSSMPIIGTRCTCSPCSLIERMRSRSSSHTVGLVSSTSLAAPDEKTIQLCRSNGIDSPALASILAHRDHSSSDHSPHLALAISMLSIVNGRNQAVSTLRRAVREIPPVLTIDLDRGVRLLDLLDIPPRPASMPSSG